VAFYFDAGDEMSNDGRGWLIDDVRILVEPGSRFCPPDDFGSGCPCHWPLTPAAGGCRNSVRKQTTLHSEGSPSVSADTLRMNAVELPPTTTALLTQGTAAAQVPFGDAPLASAARASAGARSRRSTAPRAGTAPGAVPLSIRGEIPAAGATRYDSVFYRDLGHYCSSGFFNSSDGQQITWVTRRAVPHYFPRHPFSLRGLS
jgi:hypothetical protein